MSEHDPNARRARTGDDPDLNARRAPTDDPDTALGRAIRRAAGALDGHDEQRASRRLVERAAREGLLDVAYAELDSPLGRLLAATTPRGLVYLAYPELPRDPLLERLSRQLSPRLLEAPARFDEVRRELDEYFAGARRGFELAVDWSLIAGFGLRVLEATARIPYGQVSTYERMAALAGSPRGSRAAGNALGANPIPIVIPCHRVLRKGGSLGGYGGGLERKRYLLELEGAL